MRRGGSAADRADHMLWELVKRQVYRWVKNPPPFPEASLFILL
jgi:hypothetical protein